MNDTTNFIDNGVEGIRSGYGDGISQATGDLIGLVEAGAED